MKDALVAWMPVSNVAYCIAVPFACMNKRQRRIHTAKVINGKMSMASPSCKPLRSCSGTCSIGTGDLWKGVVYIILS